MTAQSASLLVVAVVVVLLFKCLERCICSPQVSIRRLEGMPICYSWIIKTITMIKVIKTIGSMISYYSIEGGGVRYSNNRIERVRGCVIPCSY